MKTPQHRTPSRCLLFATMILSLLLVGCGSTGKCFRTYSGPQRDRADIALLTVQREFTRGSAIIKSVDGVSLGHAWKFNNTRFVEMEPGKHNVTVEYLSGNVRSIKPVSLEFEVEAGGTYALRVAEAEKSFTEAMLLALGGRWYWTAWIVDVNSRKVIAGKAREEPLHWYEK